MGSKIAYIVSRFPKISETFILYEMQALSELGTEIELFPLVRHHEPVMHAEARDWVQRAHYEQWYSMTVILSQIYWLMHAPLGYFALWRDVLWAHRHNPKFLSRSALTVWLAGGMARAMLALEIEHIHAHWATHATTAAYAVHRLSGISYSFTAHAHDIYVDPSMLAEKMRTAVFCVTISDYNRQLLDKRYGKELVKRLHVLHCGVDLDLFQPHEKRVPDPFTIITVAALEEKKGHRYLLEACKLALQSGVEIQCEFIGDGPERTYLESQIIKLGLQDYVTLWGSQARTEVIKLLQRADLMVLPSICLASGKQEGIPVALMEALAIGLPVIATDISGISELVEHGKSGLLVPERDAVALADAIIHLIQNPDLSSELGENGRRKILVDFNLEKNSKRLHELIIQHSRDGSAQFGLSPNNRLKAHESEVER